MADPSDRNRDFSNFQNVMDGFVPDATPDPFVAAAEAQQGFTGLDTNQAAINQRLAELQALMNPTPKVVDTAPRGAVTPEMAQRALSLTQRPAFQAVMQPEAAPQQAAPQLRGVQSDYDKQMLGGDMQMPMESIQARAPQPSQTQNMPSMSVTPQGPQAPADIQQLFSGFQPEAQLQQLSGLGIGRMQPPVTNPATAGMTSPEALMSQSGLQVVGAGPGTADATASSVGNPYQYGSPDWIAYEQYIAGGR